MQARAWGMMAMRERSCLTPRWEMSMPSMVIFPLSRSMRRKMQLIRLLLPAPVCRKHRYVFDPL